jgi:putative tryptophan/tyrosine transport system substrate-binding protein
MRRRRFLGLAGLVLIAPLAVRAQRERVRQIAMLSEFSEAQMQPLVAAFREQLQRLGWRQDAFSIDLHFAIVDAAQFQAAAAAIVATNPDIIVALGSRALRALKEQTQTIPIVFTLVADPVAQGLVKSLARPEGNYTGLTNYEYSFPGKWLDALKEIEPRIRRVLLLVNPQNSGTLALAKAVEDMGPDYGLEMVSGPVRTAAEIENVLDQFGAGADRAVIVLPDGLVVNNRAMLIERINRARLPSVFPFRSFAESGGLLSWGLDFVDVYRQAAIYVDRLLKGEKPSELPIQAPNKFDLAINLKTAKALGLTIPPTLLAAADEVIE